MNNAGIGGATLDADAFVRATELSGGWVGILYAICFFVDRLSFVFKLNIYIVLN